MYFRSTAIDEGTKPQGGTYMYATDNHGSYCQRTHDIIKVSYCNLSIYIFLFQYFLYAGASSERVKFVNNSYININLIQKDWQQRNCQLWVHELRLA